LGEFAEIQIGSPGVLDSALLTDDDPADLIITTKARFLSCNSRWLRLTVCADGRFGYYKIAVAGLAYFLNVTRYMMLGLGEAFLRFLIPRRHCLGFAASCPYRTVGAHKRSAIDHFAILPIGSFAHWQI
jgi:hypothetical protein